jgi:imidazole glycerol-phosphate synthase subunit HisH
MIGVIDCGTGNVSAFLHLLRHRGHSAAAVSTADAVERSTRLILPGVGSFDRAMRLLNASGLRAALEHAVLRDGRPLLGVCIGMQMLGSGSDEGDELGLGWIHGKAVRLATGPGVGLRLPHMGWNDVHPVSRAGLFEGLNEPRFYFLHSYTFEPEGMENVLAYAEYGSPIVAAIRSGNIWGTQFHPEKSHRWGAQVLDNFVRAATDAPA